MVSSGFPRSSLAEKFEIASFLAFSSALEITA